MTTNFIHQGVIPYGTTLPSAVGKASHIRKQDDLCLAIHDSGLLDDPAPRLFKSNGFLLYLLSPHKTNRDQTKTRKI
jgi:hypothetical protein